jgi:hypothetical protein
MNGLRNMPGYFLVIASDYFELDATLGKVHDGFLHIGLWWVKEQQETDKNHFLFIGARIGSSSIIQFPDCHAEYAEAFLAPLAVALFNPHQNFIIQLMAFIAHLYPDTKLKNVWLSRIWREKAQPRRARRPQRRNKA